MKNAEVLKNIRKKMNISQETFAHELSVSFTRLNRWKNNCAKLSCLALAQLKEFAAQSNMSLEVTTAIEQIKFCQKRMA